MFLNFSNSIMLLELAVWSYARVDVIDYLTSNQENLKKNKHEHHYKYCLRLRFKELSPLCYGEATPHYIL